MTSLIIAIPYLIGAKIPKPIIKRLTPIITIDLLKNNSKPPRQAAKKVTKIIFLFPIFSSQTIKKMMLIKLPINKLMRRFIRTEASEQWNGPN